MKLPETTTQTSVTKHPRRSILRIGAAALAGWFAALQTSPASAAPVAAENGVVAPELEGTWLETVTFHGENLPPEAQTPFPTFITFARGGGLLTISSSIAPTRGNMSFGSWKKVGNKYVYTFMGFYYDAQGVLENYVKIVETLRFEKDGKSYNGEAKAQMFDVNMNLLGGAEATTHATRIMAGE